MLNKIGLARKPKLVIFDFDGCLADLKADRTAAKKKLSVYFKNFGFVSTFTPLNQELKKALSGIGTNAKDQAKQIKKESFLILAAAEIEGLENTKPSPFVNACLKKINAAGIKIAVISNNSQKVLTRAVKKFNWPVSLILGREDIFPRVKPDPYPIKLALKRLGLLSSETWAVGHSPQDLTAYQQGQIGKIFLLNKNSKGKIFVRINSLKDILLLISQIKDE